MRPRKLPARSNPEPVGATHYRAGASLRRLFFVNLGDSIPISQGCFPNRYTVPRIPLIAWRQLVNDGAQPGLKEEWVIWNGTSGLLTTTTIGRIETGAEGRAAWMDPPFDMVGPFNLDELEAKGRIEFAACTIMSRQRWQEDQGELRQQAYEKRRAAQERMREEEARFNESRWGYQPYLRQSDERQHRETLDLPPEGELEPSQIKAAFRRLAQKAHPDVGGTHEEFLRISEARNALLECYS